MPFTILITKNTSLPNTTTLSQQHLLEISQTWVPGGGAFGGVGGDEKLPLKAKVLHLSALHSSSHPSSPQGPSGSLLLCSGCGPRSSGNDSRHPARRTALAGAGEPCGERRGAAEKEASTPEMMPRRGGGSRREGSRGGAGASREGAQSPGPGLPPPLLAPAADLERLLREIC